jgi:phosphoglycolate phosphatase
MAREWFTCNRRATAVNGSAKASDGTEAMRVAIEGIVFDKDGTLFDFEATWREAVQAMLVMLAPEDASRQREIGRAVGFDLVSGRFVPGSPLVAGSAEGVAAALAPLLPGIDAPTIERLGNMAAQSLSSQSLVPAAADLPGLLGGLRERGLRLGVATNDGEAAARSHLASAGVLELFDGIFGYDSGHGQKPGPGMVLAFAQACGVAPEALVMVGDSVHDLGAGRAAGVARVVGVLTGPAREADLEPMADAVIASIDALPALLDSWA